jgi:hypothetical protein
MSRFPATGDFPFEITSNASKPKIGGLALTYTQQADGSLTNAVATYFPPNNGKSQDITVTFTGTSAPYAGQNNDIQPPWNIPGGGGPFKSATFSFTPATSAPNSGTLTGTANKEPTPKDPDITWESDPSVSVEGSHAHHYDRKYSSHS